MSVHKQRKPFAKHLIDTDTYIRYIQQLLGHSMIKTTMINTRVPNNAIYGIQSPLQVKFGNRK